MFILKKLHIENFMSIDCADFTFSDTQITQVTGDNGSGKSSLFYAIAYTLFGYRVGESINNYVKIGTESANIHLEVMFNDLPLIYDVEIPGSKSKVITNARKVIYKDKVYLNSDYNQFLQTYGMEDFESLMFMFQDSKSIIDARPSERANMLRKLFKFEFPEIVETLKEQQETIKIKTAEHRAVIEDLKNRQFNKLQLMREIVPASLEKWEGRITDIQSLLNQIGDINETEILSCDKTLFETENFCRSMETTINLDRVSLNKLKCQLKDLQEELQGVNAKELQNSINIWTEKLKYYEKDYKECKEKDIILNEELKVLQYKENEIKSQLEISRTGVCHACGQPIEETHIKNLKEKLQDTQQELAHKKWDISLLHLDFLEANGKTIQNTLAYNEELLKKYNNDVKTKESLLIRINDLENLITERQNLLKESQNKVGLLIDKKVNLANITRLLAEKNELIKEKDELKVKLQEARDNRIKNIERRNTNLKIEQEQKERDAKLLRLNKELNDTSITLARIKQELDIFESKFPNYIVLQACQQLEDTINDIVQHVFPYCMVSLKLSKGGVNFYYTPESGDEDWVSVSMASGAQKKILSLAYFIALARFNNISCVFLDEIDASMTDTNASVIYEFIASLNYFPQMFFISHRESAHEAVKAKNERLVTYTIDKGIYTMM